MFSATNPIRPRFIIPAVVGAIVFGFALQHWFKEDIHFGILARTPWLGSMFLFTLWIGLGFVGCRSTLVAGGMGSALTLFYFSNAGVLARGFDALPRIAILALTASVPFWIAWRYLRQGVYHPDKRYIPTLDGWRALAILLVIVDHVDYASEVSRGWSNQIFHQAQHGVTVFFVLSGFLITTLLLEEREKTGDLDLRSFYYRRVFRILPAAYAFLAVVAVLSAFRVVDGSTYALSGCVLFVRNYIFSNSRATDHFWSLAVEEQFYLFMPAALLFLRRRTAVVLGIVVCFAVAGWRWYMILSPTYADPLQDFRLRMHTDFRIDCLLYGALLAGAMRVEVVAKWMKKILHPAVWCVLLGLFVYDLRIVDNYTTVYRLTLITALLAGTVLRPTALPARILELAPLRWIGRISYSLYLWQNLFTFVPIAPPRGMFWWQYFPYNLILSFVAAALSYYLLERPILKWARYQRIPPAETSKADSPAVAEPAYASSTV